MRGLPKKTPTLIGMDAFHTVPADETATPVRLIPPPPPRKRRDPDSDPVPLSRRKRKGSVTMPSVRVPSWPPPEEPPHRDIEPVAHQRETRRKITSPVLAAVRGLPDDLEMKAAQHALDKAAELDALRDTLLSFPEWVPVSQPMLAITREAKRFRQIAGQLLHVDSAVLED